MYLIIIYSYVHTVFLTNVTLLVLKLTTQAYKL